MEIEETQKMPKLTQKIVDNFFVPENSQIDNSKAKVIGRDGKVVSTNENSTNKKFKSFKWIHIMGMYDSIIELQKFYIQLKNPHI